MQLDMPVPLLSTKLYIPPVRMDAIPRPRLTGRLLNGLNQPGCFALLSGPAGSGKTTLLSDFAAQRQRQLAWLSLDEGDNDPARFWTYLIQACRTVEKGAGEAALGLLQTGQSLPDEAIPTLLINDLSLHGRSITLVLDDYHEIQDASIQAGLLFLIDHVPPNLHILVSTRSDPPWPLARYRARSRLIEIRAQDLRFSQEEALEFLNRTMGLNLAEEDAAALGKRTEGWAAGLQLAAIALQARAARQETSDTASFVKAFTASHIYAAEYLVEEVLQRQPEEVQSFLLKTSILERLNAALCEDVLAAQTGSQHILEYLERANLFLIPLDDEGCWFRYHHLFADLLRARLRQAYPAEAIADLHRRAAAWHHETGSPVEAIRHALSGRDWSTAADLMEHWSTEFFKSGALGAYLPLLRALPAGELQRHPQLLQDMGWGLALTNDLEQANYYLGLAEAALPDEPNFLGETLAGQAYAACYQFDIPRTLRLGRRALELLPLENEWMRSVSAMVLGLAHWFNGDPAAAQETMQTALKSARRSNGQRVEKMALAYLGRTSALEMDFLTAEEMGLKAIGPDPHPQLSPGNDVPGFDLGALYYEWNDLESAGRYLELGFAANEASGNLLTRVTGLRTLARLRMAQGRAAEAHAAAQQAVHLTAEMGLARSFQELNAACWVEISLAQGNLEQAEEWASRIGGCEGLDAFQPLPRLAQARVWIARGRRETALRLLAKLEPQTEGPAWRFARFRLRLLQALAEPQRAPAWLAPDLLAAALRQRLARSFIDLGRPMASVLRALQPPVEAGRAAWFAALLRACESGGFTSTAPIPEMPPGAPPLPPLVEPLSERELEVLRAMAAGESTAGIAAGLYLAESTVRTHIKKIFAKLDAHSRLQAVEQARRRGLI